MSLVCVTFNNICETKSFLFLDLMSDHTINYILMQNNLIKTFLSISILLVHKMSGGLFISLMWHIVLDQ